MFFDCHVSKMDRRKAIDGNREWGIDLPTPHNITRRTRRTRNLVNGKNSFVFSRFRVKIRVGSSRFPRSRCFEKAKGFFKAEATQPSQL